MEEINRALAVHEDIQENIVKVELKYYKHTHKADVTARPDLFKLNMIGHQERLENLCTLLSDEGHDASHLYSSIHLPSNEEAIQILKPGSDVTPTEMPSVAPESPVQVNELCITMWESGWYLGYALQVTETTIYVDHLERVSKDSDDL